MNTKLRFPNGELATVDSIKDIRVAEKTVTVEIKTTYESKKITFESDLSQNEVDKIWNAAITDLKGIVISWEEHEKESRSDV